MVWLVAALALWFFLAFVVATVVGRGVDLADRRARRGVLATADLPGMPTAA